MDAPRLALQRPVGEAVLDQTRVRHEDIDVVVGADAHAARTDLMHDAAHIAVRQFNVIADIDDRIEQQHQAGHEFLDHALQAKTHADAERACEHRDRTQIETDGRQREQDADDGNAIGCEFFEDIERRAAARRAAAKARNQVRNDARNEDGKNDDRRGDDHAGQGDRRAADIGERERQDFMRG